MRSREEQATNSLREWWKARLIYRHGSWHRDVHHHEIRVRLQILRRMRGDEVTGVQMIDSIRGVA